MNMNREPRFYAWVAFENGYYECRTDDKRYAYHKFWGAERSEGDKWLTGFLATENCGVRADDGKIVTAARSQNYSKTGYLNKKGVHPGIQATVGTPGPTVEYPWPVIRLAELYLNYAEAVMERYGEISDDQLNKSINKIRARAGIANLTNALAKRIQEGVLANATKTVNQVMLDEIRRERALELYMEGFRCDDLKRWGIAEKNLNESRCGAVVGNASYPTAFVDENGNATSAFNSAIFTKGTEEVETGKGKLPCVVLLKSSDCAFTKGDYLWAIPRNQINLNSNLVQNPGY